MHNDAAPAAPNLFKYHWYKHQRATKHIIELYEAYFAETDSVQKAAIACSQLDKLNFRIRELNKEFNLADDLGLIHYGAFLYGWRQTRDGNVSPNALEDFCKRKPYMKGWSCLPPRHRYDYFLTQSQKETKEWDNIIPLLSLFWRMLKWDQSLVWVDQLENALLGYIGKANCIERDYKLDISLILSALRKISGCLSAKTDIGYEKERETLRSICVFHGFPSEWIPQNFSAEIGA